MKKFILSALVALVIVGAVIGCGTVNKTAFTATTVVVDSVSVAVDLWNAYVASGQATVDQKNTVDSAFNAYQASLKVETDAVTAYYSNPSNATNDLAAIEQVVANSQADLISAIREIVPTKTTVPGIIPTPAVSTNK